MKSIQLTQLDNIAIVVQVVEMSYRRPNRPIPKAVVYQKINGKVRRRLADANGYILCWTQTFRSQTSPVIEFWLGNKPSVRKSVRWHWMKGE